MMLNREIKHILNADNICRDRSDRIRGILHRMRIGSHMEDIIHLSQLIPVQWLIDIAGNELKKRIVSPF